jgi:histidinol phosphatase-like enzyme (inositol monophosphatase family)
MGQTPDITRLISVAHACADAARPVCLRHFRDATLTPDNKAEGHFDPVTVADRAAEAAMRAVLAEQRPDDAILGEEAPPRAGSSGLTWVLDPIDGTRAYIAGAPTWGVLIAVNAGGAPLLGVIDQPFTGERFIGQPGQGAAQWTRGSECRALQVRPCAALASATVLTTFPELGSQAEGAAFAAVATQARLVRYGLDCYAYALLAMGCVDLVIEAGLQPYDIQAPMAVIEAAGGIVTDWRGGAAENGGRVVAAGDARVHAAALETLAAVP